MKNFKIEGKFTAEVTVEQAMYINTLIERDIPLPMKANEFESDGKKYTSYYCPECDHSISKSDHFCSKCGQRIDVENIAF